MRHILPKATSPETITAAQSARFYDELAGWWPLFSPPSHYVEEATDLLSRLQGTGDSDTRSLLELGSGGGSLASHLKHHFRITLSDRSPAMLAVSRTVNPECEHVTGDMRTLRLGRQFDVVFVHDAIMYATEPVDVVSTLRTAAVHCSSEGTMLVVPDCVRETFEAGTQTGGEDGRDGRGLRYLEWRWDPDPSDHTFIVDYAFLLREANGAVSVVHDRHVHGLFPRAQWLEWFSIAGLDAQCVLDQWGRDVFIAHPA